MVKGLLLTIICLLLASSASAAPWTVYDARAMAMGGAGVAAGERSAAVQNMALAGRAVEFIDWFLTPMAGEEDRELGDQQAGLDRFQGSLSLTDLSALRGQLSHHHNFSALAVTVPSDVLGTGAYLIRSEYLGARADIGTGIADSFIEKRGVRLVEHGLGIAQFRQKRWWLPQNMVVGFTPKLILVRTMVSREPVSSANLDYVFSRDQVVLHSAFNLDLALMKELSRFTTLGLSAKNLIPFSVDYADPAAGEIQVNPMVRAGVAYQRHDLALALDVDLSSNQELAFSGRSRHLAAGGEYVLADTIAIRVGARMNMAGEQELVFTGGLGLHYRGHRLEAAVLSGDGVSGATAHLSMQF